jgi:curved DNA-binding protein CbpA
MKDYYKIMGLLPSADDVVIKAAYKALAQKNHPDKHPENKAHQTKVMSELNEAFAVLGLKAKRKAYDTRLEKFYKTKDSSAPAQSTRHSKGYSEGSADTPNDSASATRATNSERESQAKPAQSHTNTASKTSRDFGNHQSNRQDSVQSASKEYVEIIDKLKKNQIDEFELINLFEETFSLKVEIKNGYVNNYSYQKEGKVHVLNFQNIKIQLIEHLNLN